MSRSRTIPFQAPERRMPEVDDAEWMRDLLARATFGTLATHGEDGTRLQARPFLFDPATTALYLPAAQDGGDRLGLERHQTVAFSIADVSLSLDLDCTSVVLRGTTQLIRDQSEATRAHDLLREKYGSHPSASANPTRPALLKLDIDSWAGTDMAAMAPVAVDDLPQAVGQRRGW